MSKIVKNNQSYMIREIIDNYKTIMREVNKMQSPKPLSPSEKERGLYVSKQGASTPKEVFMSPLMSEALKRTGEKKDDEWRLLASDPETKAEKWINDVEKSLLLQYNGSEKTDFDEDLDLLNIQHYNVQCWRNRKENKRDIGPDQEKQREELAQQYRRKTKLYGVLDLLAKDKVFQKTVEIVANAIPEVKANDDFSLVSQPFMNKDSNVSYPFFRNDRAIDPDTGKTYGQLAVEVAKRTSLDDLYKFNYTTLFGRNQKQKGRAIYATSRVVNILLNQLEAEEINAYREKSPLFVGYKDDKALKAALQQMVKDCNKHGLKCRNVDQSKFDLHVGEEFIVLVGAISMLRAKGSKSKNIALKRAVLATKTWLIDGLSQEVFEIFGRIFSGYIDTNRMGGLCNAIAVLFAIMLQDPGYSRWTYVFIFWMLVMGDDNLFVYKTLNYDKFKKDLAKIGFEVNEEKDEFGPFFLQYRLFKDESGQEVMAYAWTRVLRSLLFKETKKGLGKYGWVLAMWQQLAKVQEYRPALEILVNLVCYLDSEKLCLDIPVSQLIKLIDQEDNEALSKLKTNNARNKFQTTWDKLSDGDPQKVNFSRENPSFLEELQNSFKSVYDPSFWNKHHLPPLSKVG